MSEEQVVYHTEYFLKHAREYIEREFGEDFRIDYPIMYVDLITKYLLASSCNMQAIAIKEAGDNLAFAIRNAKF